MILSKAARLGLYAMVMMARAGDARISAGAISQAFEISENHMAKVLQQLARAGFIASVRGSGGGYHLARSAREITMLDVVETLEGPWRTSSCEDCPFRVREQCDVGAAACAIHHVLAELKEQTYYTLKSVTVAALASRDAGAMPL